MPALDRERALSSLPGNQQKEIASRLEAIDRLDPANRAALLSRYRKLESLSSEQKDHVRNVLRQFTKLPEPRREAVRSELDQLDKLSPSDRTHRLSSDDYRNRFTSQERHIIENTSSSLLQ